MRGICKAVAVPCYNINIVKGGLQLAATIRTTKEGRNTEAHRAVVPRGHNEETDGGQVAPVTERRRQQRRRPLHKAGGGSEGGRYRKRAAVTGRRYRKRAAVTGGRYTNNALG